MVAPFPVDLLVIYRPKLNNALKKNTVYNRPGAEKEHLDIISDSSNVVF